MGVDAGGRSLLISTALSFSPFSLGTKPVSAPYDAMIIIPNNDASDNEFPKLCA
jgi:hypothetical protein